MERCIFLIFENYSLFILYKPGLLCDPQKYELPDRTVICSHSSSLLGPEFHDLFMDREKNRIQCCCTYKNLDCSSSCYGCQLFFSPAHFSPQIFHWKLIYISGCQVFWVFLLQIFSYSDHLYFSDR